MTETEHRRNMVEALSCLDDAETLSIAKNLIAIPSPTERERNVALFIEDLLKREGFDVNLYDVTPGRPQVIARLKGSGGGRSLMLNGHMDNDSVTEDWQFDPYTPRVEGNRLWGAGVHNMKSGLAALLSAAIAIKRSGMKLRGDLVVAAVVGELQGGKGTIDLLQRGVRTDLAVIPEPYSTDVVITKCVGVHKCAISTIGKSIHTSRREHGIDAIEKMLGVMNVVRKMKLPPTDPDLPDLPLINIASIIGGRSRDYDLAGPSNLSDYCTIIVDVRYGGDWNPQRIDELFVKTLDEMHKSDADLRFEYHHPPPAHFRVGGADMPPMNGSADTEIAQLISKTREELSGKPVGRRGVVLPYSYCGNDTAHLERAGIPCCLYGPRGYDDDVEKHVKIDELNECARVLTGVSLKVCT